MMASGLMKTGLRNLRCGAERVGVALVDVGGLGRCGALLISKSGIRRIGARRFSATRVGSGRVGLATIGCNRRVLRVKDQCQSMAEHCF